MRRNILLFCAAITFLSYSSIYAQAPSITYAGHGVFQRGIPITPLTAANSGGAVPATGYGLVTTLAGSGAAGAANATGSAASFNAPADVAVDAAGNVYVADQKNNEIRKITPAGKVSVLAGSLTAGSADGAGTAAKFNGPTSLVVDHAGNVFVADRGNNSVRKITPDGTVTTVYSATPSTDSQINIGLVSIDGSGNVYASRLYPFTNGTTIKITPAGIVSSIQTPDQGFGFFVTADGTYYYQLPSYYGSGDEDYVLVWWESTPNGNIERVGHAGLDIAVDKFKSFYVTAGNGIQKTTVANGYSSLAGSVDYPGDANGANAAARFNAPNGITTDSLGYLYVADQGNNKIKKVSVYGYSISPALPAGLTFNPANGTISGTPIVTAPNFPYTITAYNSSGQSTTAVNIQVDSLPAITYGAADLDPRPDLTGVTYTSSNASVATIVNNKIHVTGVGITYITGTKFGVSQSVPIQVNKANLTVTANNLVKSYTENNPPLTLTYSGFVYGQAPGNLILQPVPSTTATAGSAPGTYPITLSNGIAANYNITLVPGTLTINALPALTYGDGQVDPGPVLQV